MKWTETLSQKVHQIDLHWSLKWQKCLPWTQFRLYALNAVAIFIRAIEYQFFYSIVSKLEILILWQELHCMYYTNALTYQLFCPVWRHSFIAADCFHFDVTQIRAFTQMCTLKTALRLNNRYSGIEGSPYYCCKCC